MRNLVCLAALLIGVMSCTGCFWRKHKAPPPSVVNVSPKGTNAPAGEKFVITPGEGLTGRVASANATLRFVVLTFPLGQLPANDSLMDVYRNGNKVGEVKITGPQRDENTVADVVSGGAEKGDEVRQK